ncbi:2-succinyl-6-hydroxy-2,4-cyclohexadiene-1-carboxylate synthase [Sporosarcina sp. 179-K 3D1 HS]|uniref:2-succinyl-6-hydroxy-2, 4-cyclohexadiene-1-carboxylate synthase n=1 Tax=Sporosarcina sp. 179-K 3D1 HS TaxID=3232169 RepID=UPI0039A3F7F2
MHVEIERNAHLPAIVMLHGFTGSTKTWRSVIQHWQGRFRTVAIDLIGHGKTDKPLKANRYTMEEQVQDLDEVVAQLGLERFTLLGYSMGGRTALAYAVEFPEKVERLILESSSPGLKLEEERELRKAADDQLANRILENGLAAFVDMWENIPLFDSQKALPEEIRHAIREERLSQSEIGLANSLWGMGTGCQRSYWDELEKLTLPVLLITGEIDKKFVTISREMVRYLPNGIHETISGAGHAIHVEKPDIFATMIEKYVNSEEE